MSRDINQEKLEESKRHQFDAYCKKILRNEARDIYDERKRRQKREVLFSEMQPYELDALYTMPRYFDFEQTLRACGLDFLVCDEDVFESLSALGTRRRAIVLLSYYLGLTDREIGEMIDLERANVQYHRKQALKELKNMMDEKGDSL